MNQGGKFFVQIRIFLLAGLVVGAGWFGIAKLRNKPETPAEAADTVNSDTQFIAQIKNMTDISQLLIQGHSLSATNPHQAAIVFRHVVELAPENRDANLGLVWAILADKNNLTETTINEAKKALAVARTIDPLDPAIAELQTAISQTRTGA